MSSKEYKTYLIGKINGTFYEEQKEWRMIAERVAKQYCNLYDKKLTVINPADYYDFKDNNHKTEHEVMHFNLYHATSSDFVIVNLKGLNASVDSVIEIRECFNKGVFILGFGSNDDIAELHPWLKMMFYRIENTVPQVFDYLVEYMLL